MATPTDPDELYGLPLDEFTAARNALAKEVGKQGDKAAAAEIKRLPKPSKTAWALNQLARRDAAGIEKLLESGTRLRAAQQRALAGDASRLREATRAEQDHVSRLVDAALAILGGEAGAAEERLRRTLRAAANDPDVGDLLRRGRLVADLEPSGFGLDGLSELALPDGPLDPVAVDDGRDTEQERERREREAAARQAAREAERLQKAAERARDRAARMVEEADAAERRAREARRMADEAVAAAEEAQRLADEAAGAAAGS